ncbi:FAD binding domain-containing protein [Rhizobium leguminosarum]|uniref:FAD binding domain-containing protein n=1 Tax=Rhizobium leguminosarum TaxID=384 RepID=UPI0013C26BDD|nr:FAD binding domain-containing protein [Rhizobium leguminosarum]NEH97724.1 xanthine dehydrogenase family protein subunit M [Rhizobium leguminosarum]NEJ44463.1 xanthine dehydrogenase family protein subunit M [Rhizobium leguminosarum]NEJ54140.1 xanthine dehydrogenase family protein subunit M [Rhizobium leguminosarum]NEJ82407.1 xanthine dehydrogenase family protein subunit M [Rhizobium leguminosarum]
MLSVDTYQTVAEAAGAMTDRSRFLGGGTLIMRAVNYGDQSFDRIVRSRQLDRTIKAESSGVRIGAAATMTDILASRDVQFLHPVARVIGGPAIRNMATVGGNLFAPAPYGDFAAALLALDARIVMSSGQAEPVESFLAGRNHTRGVVVAVQIPAVNEADFRFLKVSRVKPKGISMLSIAALLRRGDTRIAWGNMGQTPLRSKAAERLLNNAPLDEAGIAPALAVCAQDLQPFDDALATAWYRREVAPVHLKRLLLDGGRR